LPAVPRNQTPVVSATELLAARRSPAIGDADVNRAKIEGAQTR
jgi:hypothetical protein